MSPSWIDRLRARFTPRASAGIVIGRQYVGFAQVAADSGGPVVDALLEVKLDTRLFVAPPTSDTTNVVAAALEKTTATIKDRYVPVHISLPDAAVRTATFELDELPKTRTARIELARWLFTREEENSKPIICSIQELGSDNGKHLLLCLALDQAWYQAVSEGLLRNGVVPWSLSTNACRLFNYFHDRLTNGAGALVAVTVDAWSLLLWDAQGRIRYVRARWRTTSDAYSEIAADVERSILAYVYGAPNREITHVYALTDSANDEFTTSLDKHLREPSVRLSMPNGLLDSPAAQAVASAPLVLAAAFQV